LASLSKYRASYNCQCHGKCSLDCETDTAESVTNNTLRDRYFPYFITVAALVISFIGFMIWLLYNRRLLPSIVMIGSFILFILWLVGLIVVSVQLWGNNGSVSSNCNLAVFNQNPMGESLYTLAWLEQRNICKCRIYSNLRRYAG